MSGEKLIKLIYIYLCIEVYEAAEVINKNDDYEEKTFSWFAICLFEWIKHWINQWCEFEEV